MSPLNLFGFSGDVFGEDDPEVDVPIGTYDACVQEFTGNPFVGGGKAQLKARFTFADGSVSVTCTCYPTISAKPPEVDGNILLSFTSGVGSITAADGVYAGGGDEREHHHRGRGERARLRFEPVWIQARA